MSKTKFYKIQQNTFYNDSPLINKFANRFIKNGRKGKVYKHVYQAFEELKSLEPMYVLCKSIILLKPIIGVLKSFRKIPRKHLRRVTIIPFPLNRRRQLVIALSWFINLIIIQKQERRRHNHQNIVKTRKKMRGLSKSKKKTFSDRFHITFPNQQLYKLIKTKFEHLIETKYSQLVRRKLNLYVTITNNRMNSHFR